MNTVTALPMAVPSGLSPAMKEAAGQLHKAAAEFFFKHKDDETVDPTAAAFCVMCAFLALVPDAEREEFMRGMGEVASALVDVNRRKRAEIEAAN
jgi:hypothetical protein